MLNEQLADILYEMGLLLEMRGEAFKPRAYYTAAQTVRSTDESMRDVYKAGGLKKLKELDGIGEAIAEKIEEYIHRGAIAEHEKLKKTYPIDLLQLTALEGIGPKTAAMLYKKLNIQNVSQLEKAARAGKIAKLKGFTEKTQRNILASIGFYKEDSGRFALGLILPRVEALVERMRKSGHFGRLEIAGSARRMKETVGDIDLVATAKHPDKAMNFFVSMPEVSDVLAQGATKAMVRLSNKLEVDMRIVEPASFGAALLYFSGSKQHNIDLRKLAIETGCTLNEYGLFKLPKGSKRTDKHGAAWAKKHTTLRIAGRTEKEVYRALNLQYIPAEMRELPDCIELAKARKIPKLISYDDLKGDLQIQTDWTDGHAGLGQMARAAYAAGLSYIAITDHTKALAFIGGHNEQDIRKQMKAINALNKKLRGKPYILTSVECNILKDGSLDISDGVLSKLDIVGAGIHTHFDLPKKEQTARICKAMHNPHLDILFHPTARRILHRSAVSMDIQKVIRVAAKTKTVLEINASPTRLDLKEAYIRIASKAGVKFAINSDAHDTTHYGFLRYGIGQARRAGVRKEEVINAFARDKMLKMIKKGNG